MSENKSRIRIALLTSLDPRDRRSWSGTYYHMARALETHCGDVTCLGPVRIPFKIVLNAFGRLAQSALHRRYAADHSLALSRRYAKVFSRRLRRHSFDVIVAPAASTEIALLETDIPIAYLSDATFSLMIDYYPGFSRLLDASVRDGNEIEHRAVEKASLLVYSTKWAAQSAIRDYRADEQRVHVAPYGANLERIPSRQEVRNKRPSACCRLLFLARDWDRKGGAMAFEAFRHLESLGIEAEFTVCGCLPPRGFAHPRMTVIPFRENVGPLLEQASFLLLPTRGECSAIVFSEAAAYGLPVVTTDTGGVSEIVRDGVNGFALPLSAGGTEYARLIRNVFQNDERYREMVNSSRATFEEELNWDTWGLAMKELLGGLRSSKREPDSGHLSGEEDNSVCLS